MPSDLLANRFDIRAAELQVQAKLDAELQLVTALRDQHLAMIRLYKALGGGWRGTSLAPSSHG